MSFTPPADPTRLGSILERLDRLVDWERRDRQAAMRVDVEPAADLCRRLGDPQAAFRTVHVAGTKGKGSVAALIAEGLRQGAPGEAPVGLYGSPHVERINERVRLDLVEVGDEALADALEAGLQAHLDAQGAGSPGAEASWFDVLTVAAFDVFRRAGCGWAVVECGLGGRLDSTNVVSAPLAILTNIDLEHTDVLGDTLGAIAAEKAGIITPGAVVVSGVGPPGGEAAARVREIAGERGARLVEVPAAGTMAQCNLDLAKWALSELGIQAEFDGPAIARAALPGRAERITVAGGPLVLDGAHVASSMTLLLDELDADSKLLGPPVVLLALRKEKDARSILKALGKRADRVILTRVSVGLYWDPGELCELASSLGLSAESVPDPLHAFARVLHIRPLGGWCLVTGSLHLVGAVRPIARRAHDTSC